MTRLKTEKWMVCVTMLDKDTLTVLLDEWEEMCIVAMEKEVSDALERQDFKDLMGSLGLTPPNAQV